MSGSPIAENELDRLGRLDHAEKSRQDARARRPPRTTARGPAAAARRRGSGSRGPSRAQKTEACPSKRKIEAYTLGLPVSTHASLTR